LILIGSIGEYNLIPRVSRLNSAEDHWLH